MVRSRPLCVTQLALGVSGVALLPLSYLAAVHWSACLVFPAAAWTIATMPARIAPGRTSQAAMISARSLSTGQETVETAPDFAAPAVGGFRKLLSESVVTAAVSSPLGGSSHSANLTDPTTPTCPGFSAELLHLIRSSRLLMRVEANRVREISGGLFSPHGAFIRPWYVAPCLKTRETTLWNRAKPRTNTTPSAAWSGTGGASSWAMAS